MPVWAVVVAVIAGIVPAVWFTAHRVAHNYAATSSHTSTDLPIPPVSSGSSATATPTPSATTPATTPAAPARTLPSVAADVPRRITSGSVIDSGFDSSVTTLDAASASEVARLGSRGSPGSPGTDTVYVIGKVMTGGGSAFANLPRLKPGAKVSIRTDRGMLTYTVTAATLVKESALPANPLFTEHVRGRLVLVGIRYGASGDRLANALVVTADLSGARKA